MPAWRLNGEDVAVQRYDAAAFDSPAQPEFVAHVALSEEARQRLRRANEGIAMVHMGPPFRSTVQGHPVQMIATAGLDPVQYPQIKAFIDELHLEYGAQIDRKRRHPRVNAEDQYTIVPPAKGPEPNRPYWRFSCVGFVLSAYQHAGIRLVAEDQLPSVEISVLKQAYPSIASRLDSVDDRIKFGLAPENDRWPVILAGYVINSLARDVGTIQSDPYNPVAGDEFFPPRRALKATEDRSIEVRN